MAALRAELSADGAPVVGFAGRLVPEKGLQDVLRALPSLRRQHGAVLAVAGSGPHDAELRALARELRLGRGVRWLGFLDDAALAAFYRVVDVVVVPSRYEPFGIVALEAVAAGTPVVVARTGGLGDLVEAGVAAASFAPEHVHDLRTAVADVLAAPGGGRASSPARPAHRHAATTRGRPSRRAPPRCTSGSSASASLTTRAGAPTATEPGGRSRVTTALAPTTVPAPMTTPRVTVALVPSHTSGPMRTRDFVMP